MCHKLCSFHQCHKHTRGDGDNFGLNYAMGCRSLSMKTAARDSCEVVVNTGRVASLARPVATSPACRSRRPTWLASGSNSPPVGDLGQCRQSHWRAGDARGSGNRPQARARGRHIRNPASRGYRACVRHAQGPRGSTLCRAQSAFDHATGSRISSLAAAARLPTMSGFWEYVEAGGLMSYGANFPVPFRQRRRLCRQDSAQDHGRISRTGNRAVGHRVRLQCPYPGIKSVR